MTKTPSTNGQTLLDTALQLATMGYRVFPCNADKSPMGTVVPNGCKDATTDPETIRQWWQGRPHANIGLLADGLVIVDDDRAKHGLPPWLADDPDKAYDLTGAPLQRTPSGGRHRVFRQPPGRQWRNSSKRLAPEVDTRAGNGYICVYPSKTPTGQYEWLEPLVSRAELPEPPPWLVEQLDALERPADPGKTDRATETNSRDIGLCLQSLLRIDMVDGNDGSKRLFTACCRVVEYGLSDAAAIRAIRAYHAIRPFPRQWSDKEILDRVRQAEHRTQRGKTNDQKKPVVRFEGISLAELDKGDYSVEWLIEKFLVTKQPAIVGGPHKTLKTLICLDMAISLATGTDFLGHYQVNRAVRSVFFSGEGGRGILQEYCRRICASKRLTMADAAGVIICDRVPLIDQMGHAEAVQAFLTENEAEAAFIDPVYRALSGADAGNLFIMGERLDRIHEAVQAVGATPILLHHVKRHRIDPTNPPDLQDLSWAGFAEHAGQWFMIGRRVPFTPNPRGLHELEMNIGGRAGQSGRWGLDIEEGLLDSDEGRYWHPTVLPWEEVAENARSVQRDRQQEDDRDAQRTVIAILAALPDGEGVFRNKLAEQAHIGHRRVERILEDLIQQGLVEQCEGKLAGHHSTTKAGAFRLTEKWHEE